MGVLLNDCLNKIDIQPELLYRLFYLKIQLIQEQFSNRTLQPFKIIIKNKGQQCFSLRPFVILFS
jgi:hypothetical protein